ncbi:MAG TPA: CHAT domain-containing protein [Leptolyngbyaceae cyanobacterium M33_DOE_097]|uniref:CHAT domain-containing protein n=1 Tax=Oscillatoriales cyanobacterium SpSt-418 TaxID=2282169 RepID=A0A7C3KH87_9CYAN|nr:CHAT domain-containing protein [Leptolyngbyaceae cyanobacterium M33_DOE_097]
MTQEFHISVTPIGGNEYLVRTERVEPGVPLAEERVFWDVEQWLKQASILMNDPLTGLLRGDNLGAISALNGDAGNQPPTSLVSLGQQLYNALFQGTIRDSWMTARGIAQHLQQVLRLRLGMKDNYLPRLPWEVMYAGDRPLATGTDVLFSRYHSSFAALSSSLQFQQVPVIQPGQPLRILMVLAAPSDQDALALRQEAQHLKEELQGNANGASGIELTILDQAGCEQLTQALEHNYYQIFHYAGHSNLGSNGGNLYLVNSKTGLTETLSGDDLAGLLANNGIRMAVFNSCRGGYTAASEGINERNLAEALVWRGIPAVLAMAERIPDDVALNLSRLFYRNLKQAYSIDLSLNRARQGLLSSYGSSQLYWALPILYLHPKYDGFLQVGHHSDELLLPDANAEPLDTLIPENELALAVGGADDDTDFLIDNPVDDFGLDDLDDTSDWETVARMVNQLSASPPVDQPVTQKAPADESLLPTGNASSRVDYSVLTQATPALKSSPAATAPAIVTSQIATETAVVADKSDDPELYQELERLLRDAGKSTAAIAAGLRAIQLTPNDPEAYRILGNALFEQGCLAEAISSYQQALKLAPNSAVVYHHLGNAFYQQGNFAEAVQSLNRAIQINPNLAAAYQKLGEALRRQNQSLGKPLQPTPVAALPADNVYDSSAWQLPPKDPVELPYTSTEPIRYLPRYGSALNRRPSLWQWVGLGAASVLLVIGGVWALRQQLPLWQKPPAEEDVITDRPLDQLSKNELMAKAIDHFNHNQLAEGQAAVEILLDRGELRAVQTVMDTVPNQKIEDPTVLFLKGRLAWQSSVRKADRDYSINDALRFWGTATDQRPSPLAQNALGFAHYTAGKPDLAGKAWFRTIELLGLQTSADAQPLPKEALTAYAGMALTLMKNAQSLPEDRRAGMYAEAIRLRQKVLKAAPQDFTPNALAQDWLWSEQAIADWRALMKL